MQGSHACSFYTAAQGAGPVCSFSFTQLCWSGFIGYSVPCLKAGLCTWEEPTLPYDNTPKIRSFVCRKIMFVTNDNELISFFTILTFPTIWNLVLFIFILSTIPQTIAAMFTVVAPMQKQYQMCALEPHTSHFAWHYVGNITLWFATLCEKNLKFWEADIATSGQNSHLDNFIQDLTWCLAEKIPKCIDWICIWIVLKHYCCSEIELTLNLFTEKFQSKNKSSVQTQKNNNILSVYQKKYHTNTEIVHGTLVNLNTKHFKIQMRHGKFMSISSWGQHSCCGIARRCRIWWSFWLAKWVHICLWSIFGQDWKDVKGLVGGNSM